MTYTPGKTLTRINKSSRCRVVRVRALVRDLLRMSLDCYVVELWEMRH